MQRCNVNVALVFSILVAVTGFLGCRSGGPEGGAPADRETLSGSGTPARAGAVTVTYYYLPG